MRKLRGFSGEIRKAFEVLWLFLCVPVLLESKSTEKVERKQEIDRSEELRAKRERQEKASGDFFLFNFATCETAMRTGMRSLG